MKIAQPQGIKVFLLFSLSLLVPPPALLAMLGIKTQTDPMPLGPPPEKYQEWSDLQELFDNAVVDEAWTMKEFEQAVVNGGVYRENCIDAHGILHLIEVEEIKLDHLWQLLPDSDKAIRGFAFKNVTINSAPASSPAIYFKFDLCSFSSYKENLSKLLFQRFSEIKFQRCSFLRSTFEWKGFHSALVFDSCNLSNSSFEVSRFDCPLKFLGCNLSNSSFHGTAVVSCIAFENCDLSNSSFKESKLGIAVIRRSNLSNTTFNGNRFSLILCEESNLSNSSFEESMFLQGESDFDNCNFFNVSFIKSRFHNALALRHCSFKETSFEEAEICRLWIEGNIPYNADFTGAHIINTPVLDNCTVKLVGSRYFHPYYNPFPGALLLTCKTQLWRCEDPREIPIRSDIIYSTPPT